MTTTATFSFSTDDIASRVYAMSALHNTVSSSDTPPTPLNPGHADMLAKVTYGAFLEIALAFFPLTADYSASEQGGVFTLDLEIPGRISADKQRGLQRLAEDALLNTVMARVYADYSDDLSDAYNATADVIIKRLRAHLDLPSPRSWF